MTARIYCPSKSATQAGTAKTNKWILEFTQESRKSIDPLMGWTSSGDTKSQIKLKFNSCEEAVSYAKKNGIIARVELPAVPKTICNSYYNNFSNSRKINWTH